MSQASEKKQAAIAALEFIKSGMILGVGTGSTVNYFIEALATQKNKIDVVIASSLETENALKAAGIPVIALTAASHVDLYVDGADEVDPFKRMIKGGGGALLREKIIATVAETFVCIVDKKKCVKRLGDFPLPVEVIPMARSYVARELVKLGGAPVLRENFLTDNGNLILDVHHLDCTKGQALESELSQIVGLVESGLFAHRVADHVLVGKIES
jgi:ribose 5-phosphate isomerase A